MRKLGTFGLPIAVCLSLALGICQAQSVLTHHVRQATQDGTAHFIGNLSSSQTLSLVIALPLRNQDELNQLLVDLYNPSSPSYHQFLTVDQFTAEFGPTQQDYDSVINFAKANGLTVVGHVAEPGEPAGDGKRGECSERVSCEPRRVSASHREPHLLRARQGADHEPWDFAVARGGSRQLLDSASRGPDAQSAEFRREVRRHHRLRPLGLVPGQRHARGLLWRIADRQRPIRRPAGVLRHRSRRPDRPTTRTPTRPIPAASSRCSPPTAPARAAWIRERAAAATTPSRLWT